MSEHGDLPTPRKPPEEDSAILRFLVRGTGWSGLFRIASTVSTLVASVLLGRMLGADNYGLFQYVNSWVALLGVIAGLGLPQVVARETATARANHAWGEIKGLQRFALGAGVLSSLIAALCGAGLWLLMEGRPGFAVLVVATGLLPLQRLYGFLGSIQRGFEAIPAAGIPQLLQQAGFALLLAAIWLVPVSMESPAGAMGLRLTAGLAALAVAVYLRARLMRHDGCLITAASARYRPRFWLSAGVPMIFMGATATLNLNADILMLGAQLGPEAAGPYHAATRGALLVSFAMTALGMPLGPVVAKLYAARQLAQLQRVVTGAMRRVALVAVPLALGLVVFGEEYLAMFGPEFAVARTALLILVIGQLLNALVGPLAVLLVMTGFERVALIGRLGATLVNVALNAALIPFFGLAGAAIATTTSLLLGKVWFLWQVHKRVGISLWRSG